MRSRFPLKFRATLVLLGCFLGLVLVEGSFRAWGAYKGVDFRVFLKELISSRRLPETIFEKDPAMQYLLKPSSQGVAASADFLLTYAINTHGERDQEWPAAQKQKFRVLILGDSFTFGEGVPFGERFSDRLRNKFPAIELTNGAVPGWGLAQAELYFETKGSAFEPNLVVVFVNQVMMERTAHHPLLLRADDPLFQVQPAWWHESYLFGYLAYWHEVRQVRERLEPKRVKAWGAFALEREGDRQESSMRSEETRRGALLTLKKFSAAVRKKGAALWLVNIDSVEGLAYLRQSEGLVDRYIDLSPRLNELSKLRDLRFRYDRHYNSGTHAEIAHWLEEDFGHLPLKP